MRSASGAGRRGYLALSVLAALLAGVVVVSGAASRGRAAEPAWSGLTRPQGPVPSGSAGSGLGPEVVSVGGAVPAVGIDEKAGLVWAAVTTGGASDSVTEFSEASQSVVATFTAPPGVDALAVDQQAGLVWAGSGGTGSHALQALTEIAESSGTVTSVDLTAAGAGGRLIGVAVDPGSARVFVLFSNGRLIGVPEATPGEPSVLSTATVAQPGGFAVDPAGSRIWITSLASDSVSAFTESGARAGGVPASIGTGAGPGSIAVDPDAGLVWVGNLDAGTLTEIRESTGAVLAPAISVGKGLAAVAVAPDQAHPDQGIVWTAGSFLPFTFDEFSEAATPARLTASGPADPAGVPEAIAIDPANGQLYEGTSEGLSPFLPLQPTLLAQDDLLFWTNEPALDSDPATTSVYFPPPIFSISGAPSWLRFDRFSGVFHGVPPAPGKFSFTITARDTLGLHGSAKTTITVISAPVFTSPTSVTFFASHRSRFQITAPGVPAPTFVIGGPTLPTGLTFVSSGLLSGTPAAGTEGTYQFFVGANNDPLGPVNVIQPLALHVVRGHAPAFISPAGKQVRLRVGHRASVVFRASGVPAAKVTIRGKLPPGLVAKKGRHGAVVLSGSPELSDAGHEYRLRLTASNVIGHVTETLVITIG